MEKILKIAKEKKSEAEVYSYFESSDSLSFENADFKDISSSKTFGISLRIIKNGLIGYSYTKNLKNPEELVKNALIGIKEKVESSFDFPYTEDVKKIKTFDEKLEKISNIDIVEECERIIKEVKKRTKGQINLSAGRTISEISILNTKGTRLTKKVSNCGFHIMINYPNTYAGIQRLFISRSFKKMDEEIIEFVTSLYNKSQKIVNPKGGKMKVLFLPEMMFVLLWRISSGTSGESLYLKETPIADKLGKKIFSEKLTIVNDPLDEESVYVTPFDDEGVKTNKFPIIEKGILKNFFFDLYYAGKTDKKSTGNGFRSGMWGGDPIRIRPRPILCSIKIEKGEKSFEELIKMMDKGMIVAGQLGAHSGNIPNGDFSIGLSPGIYVEDGKIKGRVLDAMVSGNIYEVMNNVVAIEEKIHPSYLGYYPSILFDNVSVATKG